MRNLGLTTYPIYGKKVRKFYNRSYKNILVGYYSNTIYNLLNPKGDIIRTFLATFNELRCDNDDDSL